MGRKPRPSTEPILTRARWLWIAVAGLLIGAVTLGVVWVVSDRHGPELARTMALATFSFTNVFFALTAKDELESMFSIDTFNDRKLMMFSGLSVVAIVIANELDLFNRFLHTEHLSFRQWLVCIGLAATVIVASEIWKFVLRRRVPE